MRSDACDGLMEVSIQGLSSGSFCGVSVHVAVSFRRDDSVLLSVSDDRLQRSTCTHGSIGWSPDLI